MKHEGAPGQEVTNRSRTGNASLPQCWLTQSSAPPHGKAVLRIIRLSGLIIGLSRGDGQNERVQYVAEDVRPASQTVGVVLIAKASFVGSRPWASNERCVAVVNNPVSVYHRAEMEGS